FERSKSMVLRRPTTPL
ncbi:hypothetical protein VCHENC02_5027B, partial [Vibrio harveyi]